MGFVSDNLEWDEKVGFAARITPAIFIRMALSFAFALLAVLWLLGAFYSRFAVAGYLWPLLLGATALLFVLYFIHTLQALVVMVTTEFAITNKRLLARRGLVRKHTLEVPLPRVESVAVRQGPLGTFLDYGTVTVAARGGGRRSFPAIEAPTVLRMKIRQAIEKHSHDPAQPPVTSSATPNSKDTRARDA